MDSLIRVTSGKLTHSLSASSHTLSLSLSSSPADMLTRLISHNDLIPLTPSTLTRFHSRAPPSITVADYLRRIVKYTSAEKACLLIILIYIDRVCEYHPGFTIS